MCCNFTPRSAASPGPDGLQPLPKGGFDRCPGFLCATDPDTPTARQGKPRRAFFLTMPFAATVKSLSSECPIYAGADFYA